MFRIISRSLLSPQQEAAEDLSQHAHCLGCAPGSVEKVRGAG